MNRYVVPGSIAAILHAVLFFGNSSTPIPSTLKATPAKDAETERNRIEIVENKAPESDSVERASGGTSVPAIPDVAKPYDSNAIQIPVSPHVEGTGKPDIRSIPIDRGPGGPGDNLFPVKPSMPSSLDLDSSPRTRVQIAPDYPNAAKITGLDGEVTVEFMVDEAGRVLDPHATSSTDRMFEEPAIRAVAKWRFVPGTIHGRPVRFRMAVPIVFKLNTD